MSAKRLILIPILALVLVPAASAKRQLPIPHAVAVQYRTFIDTQILASENLFLTDCKSPTSNVYNCVVVDGNGTAYAGVGIERVNQCGYKLVTTVLSTGRSKISRVYDLCGPFLYVNLP